MRRLSRSFLIALLSLSTLPLSMMACTDPEGGGGGGADPLPLAEDLDQDGIRNEEDADVDGDGVDNGLDEDIDGDGTANNQDDDVDGDGVVNGEDDTGFGHQGDAEDPDFGEGAQGDVDGDGIPNNQDTDDDGDGIPDGVVGEGSCDGGQTTVSDENADCDGYCFQVEGGLTPCDDGAPPGSGNPDSDGDGVPDNIDDDDDGDGIPDDEDPNGNGDDPVDPGEGEGEGEGGCDILTFTADETLPPRILLVVDKSGSMGDDATGYPGSKWNAARDVLSNVVTGLDNEAELGLMLYPDGDAQTNVCREGALEEAVQPNNADDIISTLDNTSPGGGTPTAPTLIRARDALAQLGVQGGSRVVVLATDGGPNCNESMDGDTCQCVTGNQNDCQQFPGNCLDNENASAAAQIVNDAGYPVFVVGIPGSENFAFVLNALADAGGTAQAGATRYYDATDAAALESALQEIAIRVGACRFDLPNNTSPDAITVTVGGTAIARDPNRDNGWDLVDANTVELFGVACTDAATTGAQVALEVCANGG
jgi:von Willebrand factor type A domain